MGSEMLRVRNVAMARMYENEGASIREVAARYGLSYGATRDAIASQTRLRARGSQATALRAIRLALSELGDATSLEIAELTGYPRWTVQDACRRAYGAGEVVQVDRLRSGIVWRLTSAAGAA